MQKIQVGNVGEASIVAPLVSPLSVYTPASQHSSTNLAAARRGGVFRTSTPRPLTTQHCWTRASSTTRHGRGGGVGGLLAHVWPSDVWLGWAYSCPS